MTNWKEAVQANQTQLIADLKDLIAVVSVRDDSRAADGAPLGPGPRDGLLKFGEFAKRDGFEFHNLANLVGYVEYAPESADDQYIALLAHVDEMPAGDGWTTDAFTAVEKQGRLYGRGSSDDKGPALAAYHALKTVRDLALPLKHKVRFILGTDEENDWACMDYYFKHEPAPLLGFSPDAEFPIINGEKGLAQYEIHFQGSNAGDVRLLKFQAGERTNMVPGKAIATIQTAAPSKVSQDFQIFLSQHAVLSGQAAIDGQQISLTVNGKQAHGAWPEDGENAGTYLADFLSQYSFKESAAAFLSYLGGIAHQDPKGSQLGIASHDDLMGDLSMNVGIMRFQQDADSYINLNVRFPKSTSNAAILKGLNSTRPVGISAEFANKGFAQAPHYVPADDPMVKSLLRIYEEQTGQKGHEQVIGGGTYGRLMKRGVGYGALFPQRESTMHQANEYIEIDDLKLADSIYAQAIYELANLD
ncbi:MAG: dipeptidase PepV [Oenococcus sp.]|uniref:dipeptidase PepV n=1 Tax=Oenococcus sp. TaxID=1979414 RepID=UPI0039EC703C